MESLLLLGINTPTLGLSTPSSNEFLLCFDNSMKNSLKTTLIIASSMKIMFLAVLARILMISIIFD